MRKKSQNLVEISLLASVVLILSITTVTIFNNKAREVANMSKVKTETVGLSAKKVDPHARPTVTMSIP